eukprot:Platyproteum_vivax@DN501_c0_g1_i1.p1
MGLPKQFIIANWTFGISRSVIGVALIITGIVIHTYSSPSGASEAGVQNFGISRQWMGNNVLLPGFAILLAAFCNFTLIRSKDNSPVLSQFFFCQTGADILLLIMTIVCCMLTVDTFRYLKSNCDGCDFNKFGHVTFGPTANQCMYGTNPCMEALADTMGSTLPATTPHAIIQTCGSLQDCTDPVYDCSFLFDHACKPNPPICLVGARPNVFMLNGHDHSAVCGLQKAKTAAIVFFVFALLVNGAAVAFMLYSTCCCPQKFFPRDSGGAHQLDIAESSLQMAEGRPIGAGTGWGMEEDEGGKPAVWNGAVGGVATGMPVQDPLASKIPMNQS